MNKKEIVIDVTCLLTIILFVYTSISKVLDYDTFLVQLNKSPMLVQAAGLVAWFIPAVEIVIAALLAIPKTRMTGLRASFILMMLFTLYITAILTYSEHVPCSCGGVLSALGWREHLVFNIAFCILLFLSILFYDQHNSRRTFRFTAVATILSLVVIGGLFGFNYDEKSKFSSFNIRLLESSLPLVDSADLTFNSYYFAGEDSLHLYLGNRTSEIVFEQVEKKTLARKTQVLTSDSIPRKSTIKTDRQNIYCAEGTVGVVLNGKLSDRVLRTSSLDIPYFIEFVPISRSRFVFRVADKNGDYTLALTSADSGFRMKPELLVKQIDGKFSVDGRLHFNRTLGRLVYVYHYRNQFVTMDTLLTRYAYRRTIDSIKVAKIIVKSVTTGNKVSSTVIPQLVVNRQSFSYHNFLFIQSNIRARNELVRDFEDHSRIDVYAFLSGQYLGSFHLPQQLSPSAREFRIADNRLFVLDGSLMYSFNIGCILNECDSLHKKTFYRPVR